MGVGQMWAPGGRPAGQRVAGRAGARARARVRRVLQAWGELEG